MSIEIANIKKSFGRTQVLNDISLDIPSGQMVALLGPSGSGKTTLLRIIAGLEHQTSGHIRFHGTDVSRLHARDRKVGFVFQHYALFRHMTVFDNIAFGLTVLPRRERPNAAAIKAKVTKLLEMVQLAHLADRYPAQLSGGQKQRVALARALAVEPQILLLDEPFGALDAQVRKELRRWLRQLHEELKFTSVFVTHDQEEALTMSDKIVVMSEGKMQQIGTPEDIYNEPVNAFVADFIGDSNIFNGIMTGKLKARFCGGEFICVDDVEEGTHITAVVRPEDVTLTRPEKGIIRGTVTSVIFKGIHYEITVESGKNEIVAQSVNSASVGERVGVVVEPDNIHIMLAEDHTNFFQVEINKNYELEYNGTVLDVKLTDLVKGSRLDEDGTVLDANGLELDRQKTRIIVSIQPQDIRMTDEISEGLVQGYISNLIYKGDHYSYVIHTDLEQDFVVDDEYLWNMEDQVGLVMPEKKMTFTVKR